MAFDDNRNLAGLTELTGTTIFTWDARNRLTAISGSTINAGFTYDVHGRRSRKSINGQTTTFQYEGLDIIRETGSGGDAAYLRTLAIDETLSRTDASTTVAYLTDALGSTVALTDGAGALGTTYTYEPFGRTLASGLASGNAFQFTGRENDGAGLYSYRARYYSTPLHRFVSEDPLLRLESLRFSGIGQLSRRSAGLIGRVWANSQNLDAFAYVRNNPTNLRDPSGCDPTEECRKNARDAFLSCLAGSLVAIGLAEAVLVGGCALTSPGLFVPCAVVVTTVLETPTIVAIVACSLAYRDLLQRCSR